MIPVFKPSLEAEELDNLKKIFKNGWIGLGPLTEDFERKFSKYAGAGHAVGVNSCTAALHLALIACDLKKNDEVIVPAVTFISTGIVVVYCGAKPVFADVKEDTLCIDAEDVEKKITKNTKVIIPVHYGGHPCEMDKLFSIANKRGIRIIEDAAHACGSSYKGKKIGSLSSMSTCFSFHAVKNLAIGDGGMITTGNAALADRLRKARWFNITKSTWDRSRKGRYFWRYDIDDVGYKYHMNDVAAAIGLAQLKKLDNMNEIRRKLVSRYNDALGGSGWIDIPVLRKGMESSCHNYVIKTRHRDDLSDYLREKDISTGVHYEPINHYKIFKGCFADVPAAERIWKKLLTLPLYPDLSFTDQDVIIGEIIKFGKDKKLQ